MKLSLYINGEIITGKANKEVVEAIAVRGNKILDVGTNEHILKLKENANTVIDLENKTLIPGIIDSHLHISMYGANQVYSVPCKDFAFNSIKDLLKEVKKKANNIPKGEWVRATGFSENSVKEQRFPTKEELDEISDEQPIIIIRTCGHISAVNSQALKIKSIDKDTKNPDGGKFGRDEDGEPNGMLYENAHMDMFSIASYTENQLTEAHRYASEKFAEKGITSIHDATGFGMYNIRALQKDSKNGVIKQRVYAMVGALNDAEEIVEHMTESGVFTGLGDEK